MRGGAEGEEEEEGHGVAGALAVVPPLPLSAPLSAGAAVGGEGGVRSAPPSEAAEDGVAQGASPQPWGCVVGGGGLIAAHEEQEKEEEEEEEVSSGRGRPVAEEQDASEGDADEFVDARSEASSWSAVSRRSTGSIGGWLMGGGGGGGGAVVVAWGAVGGGQAAGGGEACVGVVSRRATTVLEPGAPSLLAAAPGDSCIEPAPAPSGDAGVRAPNSCTCSTVRVWRAEVGRERTRAAC